MRALIYRESSHLILICEKLWEQVSKSSFTSIMRETLDTSNFQTILAKFGDQENIF